MKKNYTKLIAGSMLLAVLVSTPATSFAKENENRGRDKDEKSQNELSKKNKDTNIRNEHRCLKAFGHFFAPGWDKHNSDLAIGDECHFPFGIGKKFRGNNASSTPDTVAPVISNATFKTAKNQTVVSWTTNERSDSSVFFGTTTPVIETNPSVKTITQNGFSKNHVIVIKQLNPETTYYVKIRSRDTSGNISTSENLSFTTKALSPDTSAPVISNVATITSTSTVKIGWKTNENSTGRAYYSQTLPVIANASSTSFIENNTSTKDHVITIPNLNPNNVYYIVIESTDLTGNVSDSATFTATTLTVTTPSDITAPIISAVVGTTSGTTANVVWVTNEPATSKVFYSTSTPVTTTNSTSFINLTNLTTNHSVNIPNLATSTLYYLLIQSTDNANNVRTGTEFSVTTGN